MERQLQLRTVSGLQRQLLNIRLLPLCTDLYFIVAGEQRHSTELPGIRVDHVKNPLVCVADKNLRRFERRRGIHRSGQTGCARDSALRRNRSRSSQYGQAEEDACGP